jgi:flagellum-specific peptidoglycan hydrolase FlgJ
MLPFEEQFLRKAWQAAVNAHHIFPEMAACEAALESGYGRSQLAVQDRNLFGMKQHQHPIYGTVSLPTREFLSGEWLTLNSNWIVYPDWQSCFADRMATLRRLAKIYSHYRAALAAPDKESYITQVSLTWSTDPKRAEKVLAIYNAITGDWSATETHSP